MTPISSSIQHRFSSKAEFALCLHFFFSGFGYYGFLTSLAITLNERGYTSAQIGSLTAVFLTTSQLGRLLVADLVVRISSATAAACGCLLAGVAFVSLSGISDYYLLLASLALAGMGVSINNLASKTLAASISDEVGSSVFAKVYSAAGISLAIAAPLMSFLLSRGWARYALELVGIIYCFSAAYIGSRSLLRFKTVIAEKDLESLGYTAVLRIGYMPNVLLAAVIGWGMYGQLYSTIPLFAQHELGSAAYVGWLYTAMAIATSILQISVTRYASRFDAAKALILSYLLFLTSFSVLALLTGPVSIFAFIPAFSLGQMVFIPTLDMIISRLTIPAQRAAAYSLLSVSIAFGSSLGGGLSVATYTRMQLHGGAHLYWLSLVALSLALISVAYFLVRRLSVSTTA